MFKFFTLITTAILIFASQAKGVEFAVRYEDNRFLQYKEGVDNKDIKASIDKDGDIYTLNIEPKSPIKRVSFPWNIAKAYSDDALLYYPFRLGGTIKLNSTIEFGWKGLKYPGGLSSPFVVIYDKKVYTLIGAANWPPKNTEILYSLGRVSFHYDPSESLSVMIATSPTSWQTVVNKYRTWLYAKIKAEGLTPDYLPWMKTSNGWINVQLQNGITYNENTLKNYEKWMNVFPWIQMWGQMSPYAGGCCTYDFNIHERYTNLVDYAKAVSADSYVNRKIGFYSRPADGYGPWTNPANVKTLLDWIEVNKNNGANVHYLDVVGAVDLGPSLEVAKILRDQFPRECVIEFVTDLYPNPYLVSGSLNATSSIGYEPFPRLIRFLLNDRLMLMGECNGDWKWWGPEGEYKTIREAFLLGCAFDVIHPDNEILRLAISARNKVGWQFREVVYHDEVGLSKVPADVKVRRFRDKDGKHLFAIENWSQKPDLKFRYSAVDYDIPTEKLSIIEGQK